MGHALEAKEPISGLGRPVGNSALGDVRFLYSCLPFQVFLVFWVLS